jgi:hypothetical protein
MYMHTSMQIVLTTSCELNWFSSTWFTIFPHKTCPWPGILPIFTHPHSMLQLTTPCELNSPDIVLVHPSRLVPFFVIMWRVLAISRTHNSCMFTEQTPAVFTMTVPLILERLPHTTVSGLWGKEWTHHSDVICPIIWHSVSRLVLNWRGVREKIGRGTRGSRDLPGTNVYHTSHRRKMRHSFVREDLSEFWIVDPVPSRTHTHPSHITFKPIHLPHFPLLRIGTWLTL